MSHGRIKQGGPGSSLKGSLQKRLLLGLIVVALLTPLGILLPRLFHADGAWGEWGIERITTVFGYVPEGMKATGGLWKAPVSDYTFPTGSTSLVSQSLAYAASGLLGLVLAVCLIYVLMKVVRRRER
jgi:hypothetical protein